MRDEDVVDADRVCAEVLYTAFDGEQEVVRAARQHARIRHLLSTDPGGSWVAESDGRVEGVGAGAHPRGGLGLLALRGGRGPAGPRRRPRALRALLGLRRGRPRPHHPQLDQPAGDGHLRAHRAADPPVRRGGRDPRPRARAGRRRRGRGRRGRPRRWPTPSAASCAGAGHGRDLPVPMAHGARLLVFEDRAFAVARAQQPDPARRPRRAGPPSTCCGPSSPAPGPGRRSTSTSSRPGRTGRCRCAWTRGCRCRPTGRCSPAATLGPLAPYIPSGAYL